MDSEKIVAWVSRHTLTREQRKQLIAGGYTRFVHIDPPGRLENGHQAYCLAVEKCGRIPDLFVVKMPLKFIEQLMRKVGQRACVVEAITNRSGEWNGQWREIRAVEVHYRYWFPNGEA